MQCGGDMTERDAGAELVGDGAAQDPVQRLGIVGPQIGVGVGPDAKTPPGPCFDRAAVVAVVVAEGEHVGSGEVALLVVEGAQRVHPGIVVRCGLVVRREHRACGRDVRPPPWGWVRVTPWLPWSSGT